jgi:hypothetical protein
MAKKSTKTKTPPQYIVLSYSHNKDTNYFELGQQPEGFNKMPSELTIHTRRAEKFKGQFEDYLQSRQMHGKHKLQTGIRPVVGKQIWYGDQFEYDHDGNKVNHLLILLFSRDRQNLTVYHFNNFLPYRKTEFVKSFLKTQIKGLIL